MIRDFVANLLQEKWATKNTERINIDEDLDLIQSGLLNSLEFIEFIVCVEEEFNLEIDFDKYDPSEFTTFSGFVKVVAESAKE
jgi:acyl carrier protein